MTSADRKVLRVAAALIAEDATIAVESCQGHPRHSIAARWACGDCQKDKAGKCAAQRDYEARIASEKALLAMARRPS